MTNVCTAASHLGFLLIQARPMTVTQGTVRNRPPGSVRKMIYRLSKWKEKRATKKPRSFNRRKWLKLGPRELGFSEPRCLERKWAAGLRLPVRSEEHGELPVGANC